MLIVNILKNLERLGFNPFTGKFINGRLSEETQNQMTIIESTSMTDGKHHKTCHEKFVDLRIDLKIS